MRFWPSWWRRQRIRLWLHFLPHRIWCHWVGHRFGEPKPAWVDGPIDIPPKERVWHLLFYAKVCERCVTHEFVVDIDDELYASLLKAEIAEATEEWESGGREFWQTLQVST